VDLLVSGTDRWFGEGIQLYSHLYIHWKRHNSLPQSEIGHGKDPCSRLVVEFRTERATYTLPAQEINIDAISEQFGTNLSLQDLKVKIEIADPSTETVRVAEDAASRGGFALVVPPLNFKLSVEYGGRMVEVARFNAYVARTVAIPPGIDPSRITTGIIMESDGSVRHVPTQIVMINGLYHAQMKSLTNSTYAIVWNPLEFKDMENHWAKDVANNMGSRMVVNGTGGGQFSPDRDITRAEFAAAIVRGLGLKLESGGSSFTDVQQSDWYQSAVQAAYAYRLVDGFGDGTFRAEDKITREEAMVIVARAMEITGVETRLAGYGGGDLLGSFADAAQISEWAKRDVTKSLQAKMVSGRSHNELAPAAFVTRAEVAVMIERLLKESELI
jgi:hypothetical protein